MKLLMQPLTSINVRTEVLMLTKVEVWWYLVVQLGPNLSLYFEQVRDKSFFLNSLSLLEWFEIFFQAPLHMKLSVTKQMRHFLFTDN